MCRRFKSLERIKGDWDGLSRRILELSATDSRVWLEVVYEGDEVIGDLRERLDAAITGTGMEILRVKNTRIIDRVLGRIHDEETLDDLNVNDVFEHCLAVHEISEEQRPELLRAYQETTLVSLRRRYSGGIERLSMRILQVRFKNLNSLVGEWEIDLTHPAFASDGIFAITGPTGAGKTTILDAICLALYGRTPRLNKITKSGNEIMSRQTGDCFAEVTFETQAGRYRCHWSQHRATKEAGR